MRAGLLLMAQVMCLGLYATLSIDSQGSDAFDIERAKKALRDIGADIPGNSGRCAGCHDPNLLKLNDWIRAAVVTSWTCDLYDREHRALRMTQVELQAFAKRRVDCLRSNPDSEDSPFVPSKLGLLTAGAHTEHFAKLFQEAYRDGSWQVRYRVFLNQVGMPKSGATLAADDWSNIKDWIFYDQKPAPYLEDILGPDVQAPSRCEAFVSDELKDYVKARQNTGWARRNAEAGMKMFACDKQVNDPKECFKQVRNDQSVVFPDNTRLRESMTWAVDYPDQRMIYLTNLGWKTSYWTRSSPDGRFVGNGFNGVATNGQSTNRIQEGFSGRITDLNFDLNPGIGRKDIPVVASFDPTFFPDNSGLLFQGLRNGFCNLSVLEDPETKAITFEEVGCIKQDGVALYQSVGASLGGADYFAATGIFQGDSGPAEHVEPPTWLKKSYLTVNRIIHDGANFRVKETSSIWTPFQGDFQMSPSTELLSSRLSGVSDGVFAQMGYKISRLSLDMNATQPEAAIQLREVANLCHTGGKATFSYDERFLVTYNMVTAADYRDFGFSTPTDQSFQALVGSHNIFLTDLYSGETRRITRMGPGQHAKFPHFRSDGWLYFTVYENNIGGYWMFASDAALRYPKIP